MGQSGTVAVEFADVALNTVDSYGIKLNNLYNYVKSYKNMRFGGIMQGNQKDIVARQHSRIISKREPLAKSRRGRYNAPVDGLACTKKEVVAMAGHRSIKGSLHDEDGTWIVRARVYDPVSGKVRQRSKSTGLRVKDRTKRRAEKAMADILEAWEEEANRPIEEPPEDSKKGETPFSVYVQGWLASKDISVRPNTAKSYRDYADKHILPALGQYRVKDISWRVLQEFCDRMLASHTKNSVRKFFIVIRGALDDAVRDEAIQASPEHLVKWPKSERAQVARVLSPDEIVRLLDEAERAGEPIRAAVTLALFYGLRRSEVCGLRWMDIDFQGMTLHVRHTVTQNGSLILDDDHTKTSGSNRMLALVGQTVPYLKALRNEQRRSGLVVDKVVAWPDGRPVRPDGIKSMFRTILKRAGIERARFHDLRHTAATMLANAGVPPKQLQAFLGHDDVEVTLGVYVHASDNAAAEVSGRMDEAMAKICSPEICSDSCSESPKLVRLG